VESEFFGYRKGAFTGAQADKPGYLDTADGGTLFLDEVGELDLNMQVKLLRILEGGGYKPVGSQKTRHPDVRIIAATNRDLEKMVKAGTIREDFYYRIHIIPIRLPPLRERKDDISLLIHHFLQKYSEGREIPSIPENVMKTMQAYDWPGNIRELQNTIHRYLTLKKLDFMGISQAPVQEMSPEVIFAGGADTRLSSIMEMFEKQYIEQTLQKLNWHRSNAATALGINRRTLFRKIKAYGID
jgi:transcriptional regulator with PAS, ATPase and Fis domain